MVGSALHVTFCIPLPMVQRLELDDPSSPFQHKPFHDFKFSCAQEGRHSWFVVQGMLVTQGDEGRILNVVEWILIWATKIKTSLKFRSSSLAQECPTSHRCECPTPKSWIRDQHSCCSSWYPLSAPPFLFPFSHDGDSAAVIEGNPRIHGLSFQTLSFILGFVTDSGVTLGKFCCSDPQCPGESKGTINTKFVFLVSQCPTG